MNSAHQGHFAISVEVEGPHKIAKASFPLRYGKYSLINTAQYEFLFNLNGKTDHTALFDNLLSLLSILTELKVPIVALNIFKESTIFSDAV